MNKIRGFSLLEMMLVVGIIALALGFAIPGYQRVVIKSNRVIGKAVLQDVATRQEQFFLSHRRYGQDLAELGLGQSYHIDGSAGPVDEARAVYRIELASEEGNYSGVRAVPQNNQSRDLECGTLELGARGERRVYGYLFESPERCW